MNPKFSIVVKKYKYTCGKCDYTAFLLPFLSQMYLRYRSATRNSEVLLFFSFIAPICTTFAFLAYPFLSVFPIYIWCVFKNFPHQLKTCPKKAQIFIGALFGYIVMLRARMFRSLIPVLIIKERNIRARI